MMMCLTVIDGQLRCCLQPRLIRLLGQAVFDEYAGKIYQLKFYEETAFGSANDDY